MDTRTALLVDAFTDEPLAGNPAGVVPDAEGLSEDQMQAIASELGASETAFVLPSEEADRRVRFFTPSQEVDLCGHATVASQGHLFERGAIDGGLHTLETNVGPVEVDITDDGTVWMAQKPPEIREVDADYQRVADAMGVDVASLRDVGADLPLARATTGLPFLLVPVNFLEHLGNADPDMGAVESLCAEYDAVGLYAFTFDALESESTLHARMWAPGAGVPEDPVTGTASGACGAYLDWSGAFSPTPDEMRFEQGHYVDRPGYVEVRVDGDEVRVGGRAVTALDGEVVVPPSEGDDIIEV